ncbi:hypothetical protein PR202_ga22293 [Eleusine coracana subsp. coracana]|uniref:Chalcone synthase n=1 Tax=Eleusine coracana subsp. coracana TaxID=191504 RepID=A0AAV5D1A5_ELECO|nr:hypothetical protein PR202_ga22293 [Eleusine coracana subsp. coracana]
MRKIRRREALLLSHGGDDQQPPRVHPPHNAIPQRAHEHRHRRRPGARRRRREEGDRGVGPPGHRHHPPRRQHQLRQPRAGSRPSRGAAPRVAPHRAPDPALPPRLLRRVQRDPGRQGPRREQPGARVLVVCSEVYTPLAFGAPDEDKMDAIVVMTLFGDGAGAVIVGAAPIAQNPTERPIFRMVSASQTMIPATERALTMQIGESGIHYGMSAEVPKHVRASIEGCLAETLRPLGLGEWNSLFWVVHPGGRAILDSCEAALQLEPGKLAASRRVLSEYGNVGAATIIFVLDEMRRQNVGEKEGGVNDRVWGVMLGIGPGITIEKMVLRAG